MIIFETKRLIIRRYTETDFDNFFRLNGDDDIMRYIRPAQTREDSLDFFINKVLAGYEQQPGLGRWAMIAKDSNEFVGSFAVIPVEHSDKIQLGYSLLKENWGKGYATESTIGGIDYVFGELKLEAIAGITFPENIASQKVLMKSGFVFDSFFEEDGKQLHLYLMKRK